MIEALMPPNTFKGIRSFLGHAGFCKRFIKNFSKISHKFSDHHAQTVREGC